MAMTLNSPASTHLAASLGSGRAECQQSMRLKEIVATTISEAEDINPSAMGIGVQPKFPCELASQGKSRNRHRAALHEKSKLS